MTMSRLGSLVVSWFSDRTSDKEELSNVIHGDPRILSINFMYLRGTNLYLFGGAWTYLVLLACM